MSIADRLTLLASSKEALRVKLGLPKNLPFSEYHKHSYPFDPLTLFACGKQGIWLDPSDLKTMFQDALGTVPVTKDGDPVGLILDKSQGIHGESLLDTSYPFEMLEGTIREGEIIHLQRVSTGVSIRASNLSIKKGAMYKVSFYVESFVGNGVIVPRLNGSSLDTGGSASKVGYHETYIRSSEDGNLFQLNHASIGIDAKIRDISVQEVKGNHASQPLAASRPTYRTDGNLHWLQFDGVDDSLKISNLAAIPQPFNISLAKNETHKATVTYFSSITGSLTRYASSYWTLSFGAGHSNILLTHRSSGKILTTKVNGASSTITVDGNSQNITSGNEAMSGNVSIFSSTTTNFVHGDLYSLVVSKSPDNNNNVERYLAVKSGATL